VQVRVAAAEDGFVHMRVFQPLPYTGKPAEVRVRAAQRATLLRSLADATACSCGVPTHPQLVEARAGCTQDAPLRD
jgi:hypothetical protein